MNQPTLDFKTFTDAIDAGKYLSFTSKDIDIPDAYFDVVGITKKLFKKIFNSNDIISSGIQFELPELLDPIKLMKFSYDMFHCAEINSFTNTDFTAPYIILYSTEINQKPYVILLNLVIDYENDDMVYKIKKIRVVPFYSEYKYTLLPVNLNKLIHDLVLWSDILDMIVDYQRKIEEDVVRDPVLLNDDIADTFKGIANIAKNFLFYYDQYNLENDCYIPDCSKIALEYLEVKDNFINILNRLINCDTEEHINIVKKIVSHYKDNGQILDYLDDVNMIISSMDYNDVFVFIDNDVRKQIKTPREITYDLIMKIF